MKAMIFAAGLGTRLRPLTDRMPKALVPVAGRPMLEHVIERLKRAGCRELVVNVHHFGGQIVDFLQSRQNFGMTIHISDESDLLLDTGGGIRRARTWLDGDEPFLVHNADVLTDADPAALYRHHLAGGAEATLLVSRRDTSRYLLMDDNHRLHGWTDRRTGEVKPDDLRPDAPGLREWAFGGVHVISPALFRRMEGAEWQGPFSIIPFYLSICRKARIEGYPLTGGYWFDIGRPETLAKAEQHLSEQA